MKFRLAILLTFCLSLLIFLFSINSALGESTIFNQAVNSGLKNTVNQAYGGGNNVPLTATGPQSFAGKLIGIVNFLLTAIGVIFLGLIIYCGYVWMMARGNQQEIEKAQKILREAIIGLIIVLIARIITEFVLIQLGAATAASAA